MCLILRRRKQRFIDELSVAFKDRIEFDEPRSLEEGIIKSKNCYEQSKHESETKQDSKGNDKNKGKWNKKRGILPDTSKKENTFPHKNFNITDRRQRFKSEE